MSYVRTSTICLLLVYFVSAAGCHCFDLFMARPKSKLKATRFVLKRRIYLAEIAEQNNRTTSFGQKGLFICGHIYLGRQLLPQINNCCQEVLQNNEITSPWSNHCSMLVASGKTTTKVAVLALDSKS